MKVLKLKSDEYYKYKYSTFIQPTLTSDGVVGGNEFALEFYCPDPYSTTTSSSTCYQAFQPNTDSITIYRSEKRCSLHVRMYFPKFTKMTSLTLTVLKSTSASSPAEDISIYGGNSIGELACQVGYIDKILEDTTYTFELNDNTRYFKYYTLVASQHGTSGNDRLTISNIKVEGTEREVIPGTPTDFDFRGPSKFKAVKEDSIEYYKYGSIPNLTDSSTEHCTIDGSVASDISSGWGLVSHFYDSPFGHAYEGFFPFEIKLKFNFGESQLADWWLLDSMGFFTILPSFRIGGTVANKFKLWLSTESTSWNILNGRSGTYTIQTNTDYWIKFGWTGTEYYLDYSTDNVTFTRDITFASTKEISISTLEFGLSVSPSTSIDFADTYVTINGKKIWNGTKAELSTKDDYDYMLVTKKVKCFDK